MPSSFERPSTPASRNLLKCLTCGGGQDVGCAGGHPGREPGLLGGRALWRRIWNRRLPHPQQRRAQDAEDVKQSAPAEPVQQQRRDEQAQQVPCEDAPVSVCITDNLSTQAAQLFTDEAQDPSRLQVFCMHHTNWLVHGCVRTRVEARERGAQRQGPPGLGDARRHLHRHSFHYASTPSCPCVSRPCWCSSLTKLVGAAGVAHSPGCSWLAGRRPPRGPPWRGLQ